MNVTEYNYPVMVPGLNNVTLNTSFAYDSPMSKGAPKYALDEEFVGARSIVLTIGPATASSAIVKVWRKQGVLGRLHNIVRYIWMIP
jgi:hypothetical protein